MTSQPTEDEQGHPYCQQMWCTVLNNSSQPPRLAMTWLRSADGRSWQGCCEYCLGMLQNIAPWSVVTAPMYGPGTATEPVTAAAEPAVTAAEPAAAAAVAEAPAERVRLTAWQRWQNYKAQSPVRAEVAKTAAVWAAAAVVHHHMHEEHLRVSANLTSSVMGQTMPDGVTMRPSDQLAMYRQRTDERRQAAADREAATQAFLRGH